ncbi:MAG: cache domain-containing protein [Holosporales bacterium]|jgi:hypothetical protein|nr:cache domain-containing protein [Holosporales bacterium]
MSKGTTVLSGVILCIAIAAGVGLYFRVADDRPGVQEARDIVEEAVRYCKEAGPEKLIEEINAHKERWVRGALYVFAYKKEPRGLMVAHGANPELVNKNLYDLTDPTGKLFVKAYLDIAILSGESEVPFLWPNPVTKEVEKKVGVCKLTEDKQYVICSGSYSK